MKSNSFQRLFFAFAALLLLTWVGCCPDCPPDPSEIPPDSDPQITLLAPSEAYALAYRGESVSITFRLDDNEQLIIPVVSQEMYFIRIFNGDPGLLTVGRDPQGGMPQLSRIDPTVDPATDFARTDISLAGETVLEANGLAKHPITGQLFALLTLQGQAGRELVTIDPVTAVATGIGNTGDQVGRTGAGRRNAHTRLPGNTAIGIGGKCCALLVAAQIVL